MFQITPASREYQILQLHIIPLPNIVQLEGQFFDEKKIVFFFSSEKFVENLKIFDLIRNRDVKMAAGQWSGENGSRRFRNVHKIKNSSLLFV